MFLTSSWSYHKRKYFFFDIRCSSYVASKFWISRQLIKTSHYSRHVQRAKTMKKMLQYLRALTKGSQFVRQRNIFTGQASNIDAISEIDKCLPICFNKNISFLKSILHSRRICIMVLTVWTKTRKLNEIATFVTVYILIFCQMNLVLEWKCWKKTDSPIFWKNDINPSSLTRERKFH